MYTTEQIAQHLVEVHEGGNWTEVDLHTTLADVTYKEAVTQTPASLNTIAALLHHLTFWNRVMIRRIHGIVVPDAPDNGFAMKPLTDEAAWQALQADNQQSVTELAAAIRSVPEARLPEAIVPGQSSTYKNLQGTVEHVHYHLGQIVLLKKLIRHLQP